MAHRLVEAQVAAVRGVIQTCARPRVDADLPILQAAARGQRGGVTVVLARAYDARSAGGKSRRRKDIVVRTDTVSTVIDYAALAFWVK